MEGFDAVRLVVEPDWRLDARVGRSAARPPRRGRSRDAPTPQPPHRRDVQPPSACGHALRWGEAERGVDDERAEGARLLAATGTLDAVNRAKDAGAERGAPPGRDRATVPRGRRSETVDTLYHRPSSTGASPPRAAGVRVREAGVGGGTRVLRREVDSGLCVPRVGAEDGPRDAVDIGGRPHRCWRMRAAQLRRESPDPSVSHSRVEGIEPVDAPSSVFCDSVVDYQNQNTTRTRILFLMTEPPYQ